jgi:hypothetical protein
MKAFVAAVSDGTASPIAFEELIEVARVSVRVDRELSGR